MSNHEVDVLVVGAGVAGACVARELSRYQLDVLVLEGGLDIANGASRANSGIVHAGYDPLPGTLKARYNVAGSRLYAEWAADLGFGFIRNGSMVLAFDEQEKATLEELLNRGIANGVKDLSIISGDEARALEPALGENAIAALLAPTGAICDPYGVTLAALENAIGNGASIELDRRVTAIEKDPAGFVVRACSSSGIQSSYKARAVVNAAGVHADEVNDMACPHLFSISPKRGDYCLYDSRYGKTFARTIFQAPTNAGKGVLATPTVHGNLLVGPTAIAQADKDDAATTSEGLAFALDQVHKTWPDASRRGITATFAGVRASGNEGDFVLGEASGTPGFFNISCFDSPGLTAAPAVAADIAESVAARLSAPKRASFNPRRTPAPLLACADASARDQLIKSDASFSNVVCRCCDVTEGELLAAMRGPVPALTLDSLKWRTGATMGPCRGGACEAHIVEMMAKEYDVPVRKIQKRHAGSYVVAESGEKDAPQQPAGANGNIAPTADEYDLVVIGGGVSGMAAALTARNAGASRVLVIERDADLGGTVARLMNPTFGIVRYGEMVSGVEFARREREAFDKNPADILAGAQVLKITPGCTSPDRGSADGDNASHVVTYAGREGVASVRARSIVLACGGRERGFGELALSGGRSAGVFSAGSANAYASRLGCKLGNTAVTFGYDSGAAAAALGLVAQGIQVMGVYLDAPDASVLKPGVEGLLKSMGVNLFTGKRLVQIDGSARLEAVWMEDAETGAKERVTCDTLVASIDSTPVSALAESIGARYDVEKAAIDVDDNLSFGIPGIFTCGNARCIHDGADFATLDGEAAGRSAARYLQNA